MRRVLFITPFLFLGLICLGIIFAAWLSASAHFHPGQALFPLQESAEDLRVRSISDSTNQANYALELLDRRIIDLSELTHTPAEVAALQALDKSLDRAQIISLSVPAEIKPDLMDRLLAALEQVASKLSRLSIAPQQAPDFYQAVITRTLTFRDLVTQIITGGLQEPLNEQTYTMLPLIMSSNGVPVSHASEEAWIDPQTVVFPPGSPGAQHTFFPLTGKHSTLECTGCHLEGKFIGTDRLCSSCHASVIPASHFTGECSACHSTSAWSPANFDHSGQTNCQACHTRPNGHYSGQCSACHSTNAWRPASFNHSGQTDCQSCHTRPSNHASGQCSTCHATNAWRPASFNHSGQTDCQSCHNRPNGHWSGLCSECHNTSSWGGVQVRGHSFPIDHKNAGGVCSRCHPSNSPGYTCYNCHDRVKMESKHAEKNIFDIANRCADCHPNGKSD